MNESVIDDSFSPELLMEFVEDEKGDYVEIENLIQIKSDAIKDEQSIPLGGVDLQRNGMLFITGGSTVLLVASAFMYLQRRQAAPISKRINKMISSYKELMIKTAK